MKSIVKKIILITLASAVNPALISAGWLSSFTEFKSVVSSATTSFLQSVEKKKAAMTAFSAAVIGFCGWNMLRNRYNKNLKPNEPAAQKQKNEVPTQAAAVHSVVIPVSTPVVVTPRAVPQLHEEIAAPVVPQPAQVVPVVEARPRPGLVSASSAVVLDDGGSVEVQEVVPPRPLDRLVVRDSKKLLLREIESRCERREIPCGSIECGDVLYEDDCGDGHSCLQSSLSESMLGGWQKVEDCFCYRYFSVSFKENDALDPRKKTIVYIGSKDEENIFKERTSFTAYNLKNLCCALSVAYACDVDLLYIPYPEGNEHHVWDRLAQYMIGYSGDQQLDLSAVWIIAHGKDACKGAEQIHSFFMQQHDFQFAIEKAIYLNGSVINFVNSNIVYSFSNKNGIGMSDLRQIFVNEDDAYADIERKAHVQPTRGNIKNVLEDVLWIMQQVDNDGGKHFNATLLPVRYALPQVKKAE